MLPFWYPINISNCIVRILHPFWLCFQKSSTYLTESTSQAHVKYSGHIRLLDWVVELDTWHMLRSSPAAHSCSLINKSQPREVVHNAYLLAPHTPHPASVSFLPPKPAHWFKKLNWTKSPCHLRGFFSETLFPQVRSKSFQLVRSPGACV